MGSDERQLAVSGNALDHTATRVRVTKFYIGLATTISNASLFVCIPCSGKKSIDLSTQMVLLWIVFITPSIFSSLS